MITMMNEEGRMISRIKIKKKKDNNNNNKINE